MEVTYDMVAAAPLLVFGAARRGSMRCIRGSDFALCVRQ
jgi:hypothetical protein